MNEEIKTDLEDSNNNAKVTRRKFVQLITAGWVLLGAAAGGTSLAALRSFIPNTLKEPSKKRKVGFLEEFKIGVDERFLKDFRVFVVREEERIYALEASCSHLGCTPKWLPDQQMFDCACHGGKFSKDGMNVAGPPPRALDRVKITLADDGQIMLDKATLFVRDTARGKDEWSKEGAYLEV
ncbi:MAG: ubiquinol-cytochrome c reductase iron-sulfur subunit [Nitrospinota bacterium]